MPSITLPRSGETDERRRSGAPQRHWTRFLGGLAAIAAAGFLAPAVLAAQSGESRPADSAATRLPFVDQVAYWEQLRPRSAEDKANAEYFDYAGGFRFRRGVWISRGPGTPPPPPLPGTPRPLYDEFVSRLACRSSQIIVGTAKPRRVRLNRRETFLYTEYQLQTQKRIYPSTGRPSIALLTSGGSVDVGGVLTEAVEGPFLEAGTPHLYILRAVPRSGAFVLAGPAIKPGERWPDAFQHTYLPDELASKTVTFDRFVEDLRRAAVGCEGGRGHQPNRLAETSDRDRR